MIEPRYALRGSVQAGLGALGSVHQAQGRHQRMCRSVLSVAWTKCGDEVREMFGTSVIWINAPFRSSGDETYVATCLRPMGARDWVTS
jgi:hypothetical protein